MKKTHLINNRRRWNELDFEANLGFTFSEKIHQSQSKRRTWTVNLPITLHLTDQGIGQLEGKNSRFRLGHLELVTYIKKWVSIASWDSRTQDLQMIKVSEDELIRAFVRLNSNGGSLESVSFEIGDQTGFNFTEFDLTEEDFYQILERKFHLSGLDLTALARSSTREDPEVDPVP